MTAPGDAPTRLADESAPRSAGPRVATPSSDSGWLSSSGSIDHGRFAPGTVLDTRYRILNLAGRGGMGEVYRADDLRLGQPVALKFLPPLLLRDPVRLAQFHNEVRTARQVSHPNVCRVYDIGETAGQLFITMEYVDGEDLSSLLRRIGRLPEDKGLEIARQICAGLAAAHERGVLHRDLKPANIMLDGTGKVRIMDFSLAAIGEVQDIRAGTPAYMAPEQLSGQEVTVRSDIYALGLVLYELFTGRRAFDAKNLSDLIEQHHAGALTPPTTLVRGLDPAIEAAILRCLDPDPSRRPASAIAVSAALPGGDPLAAALAAGETPSPEMVAASGGDDAAISPAAGLAWIAVAALLVLACAWVAGRWTLLARVPLNRPAVVLADRAETLRQSFGYREPFADSASGFQYDTSYLNWAEAHGSGASGWAALPAGRPAVVRFWYRTSPSALVPENNGGDVGPSDPHLLLHGMTLTILDTNGNLLWFAAAPPQREAPASGPPPRMDWTPLFAAAGLDPHAFTDTTPSWTPGTYADERRAWSGTLPGTKTPITVQAAGYRGRPVDFKIVGPWTTPGREPSDSGRTQGTNAIVVYLLLAGAAYAAYRQVRRGRADQRGALRLAVFMTVILTAVWAASPHVSDLTAEQQRLFLRVGLGMFVGGAMYVLYLAFEPFVRRAWPSMLVGWTRVLAGRLRDPIVGRDVLLGVACGAGFTLLHFGMEVLPRAFGFPEPQPHASEFGALLGARGYVLTLLGSVNLGLQNGLITVFEVFVLRAVFDAAMRRASGWKPSPRTSERLFIAIAVVILTALTLAGNTGREWWLDVISQLVSETIVLVLLIRIGIFASTVMFFVNYVLLRVPLTLDGHAIDAGTAWFTMAWVIGLAYVGYRMATTRRTTPLPGTRTAGT
ncbi:MAG TPA: serine/threonine-protein kinase [Vicinamibacterales bacterium]|nr:serine/threonine-protein kinase [Vicinamibacterales bacterium]